MTPENSLPKPARRQQIHTRTYRGEVFEREDGLFDVEVDMQDTKPFSFDNADRGYIAAGEPLHHMKMRVTLDDTLRIVEVEARTFASPYHMCADITPNYKRLIGVQLTSGFSKKVLEITGKTAGCTHHNDILRVVGTTAFQGLWTVISRRQQARAQKQGGTAQEPELAGRAVSTALLNSCHVYGSSSPIVARQWPELYQPKEAE